MGDFNPTEVYKATQDPDSVKKHKDIIQKHNKHRTVGTAVVQGNEYDTYTEGMDALVEAVIKYKKAAGLDVNEDDPQQIIDEIENSFKRHEKYGIQGQKINKKHVLQKMKEGSAHELLDHVMDTYRGQYYGRHFKHKFRTLIPEELEFDDAMKLVNYINDKEDLGLVTDADKAELANADALRELLGQSQGKYIERKLSSDKYQGKGGD